MIGGSGRCHGPNCTQPAVIDGGFCSEGCQARWNSQFDEQARRRELVQQALRDNPPLREAAAEVFRVLAAVEPPANAPTLDDVLRTIESLPRADPPEPIKLTADQWSDLRTRHAPVGGPWWRDGALGDISGVPIEIVESVEESTPYLMAQVPQPLIVQPDVTPEAFEEFTQRFDEGLRGATKPQVASKDPQVGFIARAFHWLFGRTT